MSKSRRTPFALLHTLMVLGAALQVLVAQTSGTKPPSPEANLSGSWRVALILAGVQKDLIFKSEPHGLGSLLLIDPDAKKSASVTTLPAIWSQNTNSRISFSSEAELPLGTCCTELGTVVFKGQFQSKDSIAGKVVFVTGIDEDESPYKLRSVIGTFTAVRMVKGQRPSKTRAAPVR